MLQGNLQDGVAPMVESTPDGWASSGAEAAWFGRPGGDLGQVFRNARHRANGG
jgi:hypothetical protein